MAVVAQNFESGVTSDICCVYIWIKNSTKLLEECIQVVLPAILLGKYVFVLRNMLIMYFVKWCDCCLSFCYICDESYCNSYHCDAYSL